MRIKYKFFDIFKLLFGDFLPLVGIQSICFVLGDIFDSDDHIRIEGIRALIIGTAFALVLLVVIYFILCNFTPLRDISSPEILHKDSFPCFSLVFVFYVFSRLFLIDICNELGWNYTTVTAIVMFVYAILTGILYTAISGYIRRYRLKKINEKLDNMNRDL